MDENYTHVSVLLDASTSMRDITESTIKGFNEFLESQKSKPGKMTLTLAQFSNEYGPVNYNFEDISKVVPLNRESYIPHGMTALRDCVQRMINDTGTKLSNLPESLRPGKVLILIITDGDDTYSRKCSIATMNAMISHQRERYNWEFMFIGADITLQQAEQSYGDVSHLNSVYINKNKMAEAYSFTSAKIGNFRSANSLQAAKDALVFSADEQASLQ